jgi:branched-chain amino acid transport system ATP-binding protein
VEHVVRPRRIADEERALRAKADEVLEFLTIEHLADHKAGQVSGGQKKLLELGRTMMVDAKIVFLDEVGAGVNRTLLNTIADAILRLNRERGYTFVVIEHDMDFIGALRPGHLHGRGQGAGRRARWTRSRPTSR